MSTLAQSLLRAQCAKLHKQSNRYVMEAMASAGPVRFFLFRRAWTLYNRAENLYSLLP